MPETPTVEKYHTVGFGKLRGDRCCKITQTPTRPMQKYKIWPLPHHKRVDARSFDFKYFTQRRIGFLCMHFAPMGQKKVAKNR